MAKHKRKSYQASSSVGTNAKKSRVASTTNTVQSLGAASRRSWFTPGGAQRLHYKEFWGSQKGASWCPIAFARYLIESNPHSDWKARSVRRELLPEINILMEIVVAKTHQSYASKVGQAIKNRTGKVYDEFMEFFNSSEYRECKELARTLWKAAQRAKQAAKVIAHQGGASEMVAEARTREEVPPPTFSVSTGSEEDACSQSDGISDVEEGPSVSKWLEGVETNEMLDLPDDDVLVSPEGMVEGDLESGLTDSNVQVTSDAWILSTGQSVGQTIRAARETIPKKKRVYSLIWYGIVDVSGGDAFLNELFTAEERDEMRRDFEQEVQLAELADEQLDLLCSTMNRVNKVLSGISPTIDADALATLFETLQGSEKENALRRVVQNYACDVHRLRSTASEALVDNCTSGYLVKALLDSSSTHWRVEEGELQSLGSIAARNQQADPSNRMTAGQKVDLRVTLDDTMDRVEGLVYLRSGGLPRPGLRKFHDDRVDLVECLLEILYAVGVENMGVHSDTYRRLFVMGMQTYGRLN
ncbi:hypothetical protein HDU85_006043 [Gaertneriomyces sp. JEL0708]|nr:hypothetical protein HDU85_006043 [Gaertneriomyces sp. JEL0708]